MTSWETVISDHAHQLSLAGYLGRNYQEPSRRQYSDIDLFLLMKGGSPSDYCALSIDICRNLLLATPNSFLFASFKQQILLQTLTMCNAVPFHYLQYLGIRHLIVREVNTLPRYIPGILHNILEPNPEALARVEAAYASRASLLHPSLTRFYYYFDILNEALTFFCNAYSDILPYNLLIREAVHKIRFTARFVAIEVASPKTTNSIDISEGYAKVKPILSELGFSDLIQVYEHAMSLETKAADSIEIDTVIPLFKQLYSILDSIESLTEGLERSQ